VVLPCGAIDSRFFSMKLRIQRLLWARADRLRTAKGMVRSPRRTFQPFVPMSARVIGPTCGGMPFTPTSSSCRDSATNAGSRPVA